MSEDDKESAEHFYRRLLAIFPRAHDKDQNANVINLADHNPNIQPKNKTGSATALPADNASSVEEAQDQAQPRGIEALLRRLFEEIATDD